MRFYLFSLFDNNIDILIDLKIDLLFYCGYFHFLTFILKLIK